MQLKMGIYDDAPVSPVSQGESLPYSPSNQSATSTLSSLSFREFIHARRTNNDRGLVSNNSSRIVRNVNRRDHFESDDGNRAVNMGEFSSSGWDGWGFERSLARNKKGTVPEISCGSSPADGTQMHLETVEFDKKMMCMEKTPKAGVGRKKGSENDDRMKDCNDGETARVDGNDKTFNNNFREKNEDELDKNHPTFSTSTSEDTVESPSLQQQGTWDITRSFSFRKGNKEKQTKEKKGNKNQQLERLTDEDHEANSLMEMEENDLFALEVGLML